MSTSGTSELPCHSNVVLIEVVMGDLYKPPAQPSPKLCPVKPIVLQANFIDTAKGGMQQQYVFGPPIHLL